MFRKLTTSVGMVLLASSFALAGQAPAGEAKTAKRPRVTTAKSQTTSPAKKTSTKAKRHKKHRKAATKPAAKQQAYATPQQ
jgi:hypothetical protein